MRTAAAVLFTLVTGIGCPPHEISIQISSTGASWLPLACSTDRACVHADDAGTGGLLNPSCSCLLDGHPVPAVDHRPLQARLFLFTPSDGALRDASKCMTMPTCGDGGTAPRQLKCVADGLNQELDGAIPNGLGFDGLKDTNDVLMVFAFYEPQDPSNEEASCLRSDLVACAGLSEPLTGGAYDMTCASCQGGPKNAPGRDNGPCPKGTGKDACFLQTCEGWLAKNGY